MTPLVLIPGFMCDSRLFGPQVVHFGRERQVFLMIPKGRSIPEMACNLLSAAPERFALGGLSMGGIIAMEVYAQAPERVERLALLDTTPLPDATQNRAIRTRQIADVKAGKLDQVMQEELKPAYLVDGPAKPELLDLCLDMARSAGSEVFETQALALRDRPSQEDTLRRVDVPTLILCGRQDRLCPVERHEYMAHLIPHAMLEVIENAGHMPTLEQPEQTTAALSRWLEAP